MAGEGAVNGATIVDSSGFSASRFIEWQHAKYGQISVHGFAKLHLIHMPYGEICAPQITPGNANDSPYLK